MAMNTLSSKSYRKLFLAAAFSASAMAGALSPGTASAFGGHGLGGGFHGGFHGGGFGSRGFASGGFHRTSFGSGGFRHGFHHSQVAAARGRGPVPIIPVVGPNPSPNPGPRCIYHHCGPVWGGPPVYTPPVLVTTVGALSVDYYYGDQPIYYDGRLIHSFAACDAHTGTYVLIGFVPAATAADISAFLRDFKVAIIDGPDQESIYVIKLADRKMTAKEVQDEMAEMQTQTSVVRIIGQQTVPSASN